MVYMKKQETARLSTGRRLIKVGGSLVVSIPNEVVAQWNLKKGDEVHFTIQEGMMTIEPRGSTKVETISEEAIEAYSTEMKGIQARVTLDTEDSAIRLEFSGGKKEVTNIFVRNLWRNLPIFLRLLGLGSVSEVRKGERQPSSGRKKHGKTDVNKVA
jgi:antitoxin component of MazEF toxin-antitoxin module